MCGKKIMVGHLFLINQLTSLFYLRSTEGNEARNFNNKEAIQPSVYLMTVDSRMRFFVRRHRVIREEG